jgi:hypothetical protein
MVAACVMLAACGWRGVRVEQPVLMLRDAPEGRQPTVRIPRRSLPPAGTCRPWFPGRPSWSQPKPGSCSTLSAAVPPGAWLVYRSPDGRLLRVR